MISARFVLTLFLLVCVVGVNFAQTAAPTASPQSTEERDKARAELEAKAIRLTETVAGDAALLKLPENRAVILSQTADLLWKTDQKRARQMFRQAAEEIILAQAESEKNAGENSFFDPYRESSSRGSILQVIARRDPDLALELLVVTRSPKLIAELQKEEPQTAKTGVKPDNSEAAGGAVLVAESGDSFYGEGKYMVMHERQLEQGFATQAAENDPKRAAKLLRDSMAKNGVTYAAARVLQKLHDKDSELANALANEVAQNLIDNSTSWRDVNKQATVNSFLNQFAKPQFVTTAKTEASEYPLKVDDQLLKDLANKIADNFLKINDSNELFTFSVVFPTLERLLPERAATLRQKQTALRKTAPPQLARFEEYSALYQDSNPDPEKIVKHAVKLPAAERGHLYNTAAIQLIQKGEAERAKELLSAAPAGAERDRVLARIDAALAVKAVKDGKFDEARAIIAKLGDKNQQIEPLVKLALAFHSKNTDESRAAAVKVMEEARRLIDHTPQDDEEINGYLRLVAGYAVVEPERAFSMLERLIDQANDLLQAAALLSKFDKRNGVFRSGEMIVGPGLSGRNHFLRYLKDLGLLAAVDFDRTQRLAERFGRQDAQLVARLLVAQSVLSEKPSANSTTVAPFDLDGEAAFSLD